MARQEDVEAIRDALALLLDVPDNAETHEAALNASEAVARLSAELDEARRDHGRAIRIGLNQQRRAEAAEAEAAKTVVRRRLIDLTRGATLTGRYRDGRRPVMVELGDEGSVDNVVSIVEARERLRRVGRVPLSGLEREALRRVVVGEPCPKPVMHNALARVRRKLAAVA